MGSVELMVDCNVLKLIDNLLKGSIKDKETLEDLEHVGTILE